MGLTIVTRRAKDFHDVVSHEFSSLTHRNVVIIAGIGGSNMISYSAALNRLNSVIKFVLKCLSIGVNDGNCCMTIQEDFAVMNVLSSTYSQISDFQHYHTFLSVLRYTSDPSLFVQVKYAVFVYGY